ncbi:hypothetical protein H0H87_007878 [Tephrocybe sp. NHM501043]|nr:hypothetical protein H0H87_007878 [Tephrocybe sp. NHM501043]
MAAHGQPLLLSAGHSPRNLNAELDSTTVDLVNTVANLAKDAGEMLKGVPYVKGVAGIILQIIAIRDEINTAKERSHELINKVLRKSSVILEGLLSVARLPNKGMLTRIEGRLKDYRSILVEVFRVLQGNASKDIFQRVVNRKSRLGDLKKYNRLVDDYNSDLLTDLGLQTVISVQPQPSVSSATALPFVFKPVLPPAPQLMIGRDEQRSEVIAALLDKSPARIAILGAGGMGKTTLALSVLHEQTVADRYPSRYFVSCEGTPSILGLIGEIANALRLPLANRDARLLENVLSSFPEKSILCLDNLETVWDNKAVQLELEELLSYLQLPHLGLIITMRGTQRPSQVSWSKPLLAPLQSLTEAQSQHIFEKSCSQPFDDFVGQLLSAVDGIPLAISLICAMLDEGNESSKSLWGRWIEAPSRVLENGRKDRLSNLDTSIRLSVESPRMQAEPRTIDILAMLSILPDGFSDNEKAKEHLETCLPAEYDLLEAILTMRRVSLVHIDETLESHRIRILNPVRAFCKKRLVVPEELKDSITSFYVEMMKQFKDYTAPAGHAIIPDELGNVYAVLMHAWKTGMGGPTIAYASIEFSRWSRYLGNPAEDVICSAIEGVTSSPELLGECHGELGKVQMDQGKLDNAKVSFERAAQLHQQAHDVLGEANDITKIGEVYLRRDRLDDAEATFERAAQLHGEAHDVLGEANDIKNLGRVYLRRDRLDDAEASFERAARLHQQAAVQLHRQAHDVFGEGNDVKNLGKVYLRRDRLDDAEASFERAAQLHRQAHDVLGEVNDIKNLGKVYLRRDRLDDAEASFERAARLHHQAHNVLGEANSNTNLGQVYLQRGRLDDAEVLFQRAVELHQQSSSVFGEANDVHFLGEVYLQRGALDQAEQLLDRAVGLHRQSHSLYGEAEDVHYLGEVHLRRDKLKDAYALFKRAIELHRRAHSVRDEAIVAEKLRKVQLLLGNPDKVEDMVLPGAELCKQDEPSAPGST